MALLTASLALVIYPLAIFLGFSFNPVEFRWGARLAESGQTYRPIPETLRDKADGATRCLNFLVDGFILALVVALSRTLSLSPAQIGLQLTRWQRSLTIGLVVGAVLVLMEFLALRQVPIAPKFDFTRRVRKGSPVLWVLILVSSAFSEELWIGRVAQVWHLILNLRVPHRRWFCEGGAFLAAARRIDRSPLSARAASPARAFTSIESIRAKFYLLMDTFDDSTQVVSNL